MQPICVDTIIFSKYWIEFYRKCPSKTFAEGCGFLKTKQKTHNLNNDLFPFELFKKIKMRINLPHCQKCKVQFSSTLYFFISFFSDGFLESGFENKILPVSNRMLLSPSKTISSWNIWLKAYY